MTLNLNDIPVGALILGGDARILDANGEAAALVGLEVDALKERRFTEVFGCEPPSDHDSDRASDVTLDERTLRVIAGESSADRRIFLLVDVTDLASERRAATELARSRSKFLGKLSHEIRSALASMMGFADLLKEGVSEPNREIAGLITMSGRHLVDTLNAVMDMARIEFGDKEIELTDVDVTAKVNERVAVFQRDAEKKGLSLLAEIPSERVSARLNPVFLDRILHNLIDNAIKYTDAGSITVRLDAPDDQVRIQVIDTGPGIDEAFRPRLFLPFERDRRGGEQHQGMGLGLAVTRYLVKLMDGEISVIDERGSGSTFVVTFPIRSPDETGVDRA